MHPLPCSGAGLLHSRILFPLMGMRVSPPHSLLDSFAVGVCLQWREPVTGGVSCWQSWLSSVLPTMAGWFRRLLHKPKPSSVESLKSSHSASSSPSSSSSSSAKSSSSSSTSLATSSISLSPVSAVDISASDSPRWDKSYDVCICHSEGDVELVSELVSYLEGQPESFRCFLQLRDAVAGSAVVTELCDAVQNSHCWVMLITPGFLQDPWCRYQMHQALAEAPMANGRTIPVLKDVDRKDYPRELRSIYYIYMALKEKSFRQIRDTVMHYLQELCRSSTKSME